MSKENMAEIVSGWTHSGTMLPKTPAAIQGFIDSGFYVVVYDNEDQMVGFGAKTFTWSNGWKELGAVVVDPAKRGMGYGYEVIGKLIDAAKQQGDGKFFALCNEQSLPIFEQLGAVKIEDLNTLPQDVWEACEECPNVCKARELKRLCCDTPVKIE